MGYQQVLASLGVGGLSAPDLFAAQIFMLALSLILFVGAIALCVLAFRAVGAARRLRQDVDTQFRSVQDLAVEVRHLTAQVEKAVTRRTSVPESAPSRSARVGAAATTPEADVAVSAPETENPSPEQIDAANKTPADDPEHDPASSRTLDAAKRAATEPAAILRSFIRGKKK